MAALREEVEGPTAVSHPFKPARGAGLDRVHRDFPLENSLKWPIIQIQQMETFTVRKGGIGDTGGGGGGKIKKPKL